MDLDKTLGPDGATLVSGYCKDMSNDLRLYETNVGQLGLLMDLQTKSEYCEPRSTRPSPNSVLASADACAS